jgi:DNA mismatch repair ATPase MutS
LVSALEEKEEILNNSLAPFIRGIFGRFYKYRGIFQNVCSCVAELDCLNALAIVSAAPKMCKATILPQVKNHAPIISLKKMRHPCVEYVTKK